MSPSDAEREISQESVVAPKRPSFGKRASYLLILCTISYLAVEFVYSALYVAGVISPPSYLIFDESGKTIHFDPVLGYRLTSIPSRFARITSGEREFTGTYLGNSQGFPDRADFSPQRSDPNRIRIAVFGDSFTAAQFLERDWTDVVEDLSRQQGVSLELLNFSSDGGGLANWWSVLTHLVEPEDYQLDAVLFAVLDGDLKRGFSIAEHRGYERHMFARVPSWDPEDWPDTLEEARQYLAPLSGYILSSQTYEEALRGDWQPDLNRAWRPRAAMEALNLAKRLKNRWLGTSAPESEVFQPGQLRLIEQISRFAKTTSIPALVVRIPTREGLILSLPPPKDVLQFSAHLDATFVDGSGAFAGLNIAEIRALWFPYDGHWAQSGSDQFAELMTEVLDDWTREMRAGEPHSR